MTQYQLEEVVVMKPVRTGALFSIGTIGGVALLIGAFYYGTKIYREFRSRMTLQLRSEEKPVSNISQNAGVVQVKEQYSTLEGQAVGQTGNNYLRTLPIGSFGQNFGGRTF
jgi:hypothetical protein